MNTYRIDKHLDFATPPWPKFNDGLQRYNHTNANPTILPAWLLDLMKPMLHAASQTQPPYFDLPGYMLRSWVHCPEPRRPDGVPEQESGRMHRILRSDNERHLHDHPRDYCTIILDGGYFEETPLHQNNPLGPRCVEWIAPGRVLMRKASDLHRLIVPNGCTCTTLFMTGPKVREWGFATEQGWVQWEEYGRLFGVDVK